jgi:hypothetical protein
LQSARLARILGGTIFLALLCNPIQALSGNVLPGQNVTLAWKPTASPGGAGYKLYYGGASGRYTNGISSGATNVAISGLIPGATYYFAVTSYSLLGVESAFSGEVSYTVPAPPAVEVARAVPTPPAVEVSQTVPALPAALSFQVTAAGQFVLSVSGPAGQTYEIQATQDLMTWTVIGNVTVGAGGSLDFSDTNAPGFSSRFYRAQ